jgi:hypothetical protein
MWSLCSPTARDENCSEKAVLADGKLLFRLHRLWFKAPELKAMSVNRLFNEIA